MSASLLEAMDGVAYITDPRGYIQQVGRNNWNHFADACGATMLHADALIGRNLFDFIIGEHVRASYERIQTAVINGGRRVTFLYRCDAPDVERRMRLSISPVTEGDRVSGVLYQSQILSERTRPPIRYLSVEDTIESLRADDSPVLPICSFCLRVSSDRVHWVGPEEYYQNGGDSNVRLSHGVCPDCDAGLDLELRSAPH